MLLLLYLHTEIHLCLSLRAVACLDYEIIEFKFLMHLLSCVPLSVCLLPKATKDTKPLSMGVYDYITMFCLRKQTHTHTHTHKYTLRPRVRVIMQLATKVELKTTAMHMPADLATDSVFLVSYYI